MSVMVILRSKKGRKPKFARGLEPKPSLRLTMSSRVDETKEGKEAETSIGNLEGFPLSKVPHLPSTTNQGLAWLSPPAEPSKLFPIEKTGGVGWVRRGHRDAVAVGARKIGGSAISRPSQEGNATTMQRPTDGTWEP